MRRLAILAALLALAARGETGIDATIDFVSEDVFRGASRGQGVSLQPSLAYNLLGPLTAGLWTNVRLGGSLAVTEAEYSLEWTWLTAQQTSFSAGWIYYDTYSSRRPRAPETAELFAGLVVDVPGRPALYAFYDYRALPGVYWSLAASHRFLLPDYRGSIDLSGELGLDTGRINGFRDARVSVAFSRYLGDWRISPGIDLHFPANSIDPGANGFRPVFRVSATRSW